MDLLPLRTVSLASELPPGAVADHLSALVGDGPAAAFCGRVTDGGFVVTRVGEYRSTSMPLLRGSFAAAPGGGADVVVRLRPSNTVIVFMVIWLGFLAAVAGVMLAARAHGSDRSPLLPLAPAALAAFSWYLMLSVFAADARWALESLTTAVPALRRRAPAPARGTTMEPGAPGTCPPGAHLC
jgi:hypothetical protein